MVFMVRGFFQRPRTPGVALLLPYCFSTEMGTDPISGILEMGSVPI
jgi:hypothetical protein